MGDRPPRSTDKKPRGMRTLQEDRGWMEHAACAGVKRTPGNDPFYPKESGKGRKSEMASAIALQLCQECPVRQDCFEYALTNREQHGVWGGVLFDRAARRRREEKARGPLAPDDLRHGTANGYTHYLCRCERCVEAQYNAKKRRPA